MTRSGLAAPTLSPSARSACPGGPARNGLQNHRSRAWAWRHDSRLHIDWCAADARNRCLFQLDAWQYPRHEHERRAVHEPLSTKVAGPSNGWADNRAFEIRAAKKGAGLLLDLCTVLACIAALMPSWEPIMANIKLMFGAVGLVVS